MSLPAIANNLQADCKLLLRMGSRFSEYVFGDLQSRARTGVNVPAVIASQQFRSHFLKVMLDADMTLPALKNK